jgi:hypothetical protein
VIVHERLLCCFAGPWREGLAVSLPRPEGVERWDEGQRYECDKEITSRMFSQLLEGSRNHREGRKGAGFCHHAKVFGTRICIRRHRPGHPVRKRVTRLSTEPKMGVECLGHCPRRYIALNLLRFIAGSRRYVGQTWLARQLWPGEERQLKQGNRPWLKDIL